MVIRKIERDAFVEVALPIVASGGVANRVAKPADERRR